MQPFANQSTLFVLPALQIQHGLSTQIQLVSGLSLVQDSSKPSAMLPRREGCPPWVTLHLPRSHLHASSSLSSASCVVPSSAVDTRAVQHSSSNTRTKSYYLCLLLFGEGEEQFWGGVQLITVQCTASVMHSLALCPPLHPAWMLLHSSHIRWTKLTSAEVRWGGRHGGPPGQVSLTPLATSSLRAACSTGASTVCEHQNYSVQETLESSAVSMGWISS